MPFIPVCDLLQPLQVFLHQRGQQSGPHSLDQLNQALASGHISPDAQAWFEGASGWVPIVKVPGIVLPPTIKNKSPLIVAGIAVTVLAVAGILYALLSGQNSETNETFSVASADPDSKQSVKPDEGSQSKMGSSPETENEPVSAIKPTYGDHIRPIFEKHKCYDCHDSERGKVKGDLDLAEDYSRSTVLDKKKPDLSRLVLRLKDKKDPMPPNGPMLSTQEINIIKNWMRTGAAK